MCAEGKVRATRLLPNERSLVSGTKNQHCEDGRGHELRLMCSNIMEMRGALLCRGIKWQTQTDHPQFEFSSR